MRKCPGLRARWFKMVATKALLAGGRWSQRLAIWAAADQTQQLQRVRSSSRGGQVRPRLFWRTLRPRRFSSVRTRPGVRPSRAPWKPWRAAPWTWKSGAPALELGREETVGFEPKSRCSPAVEPAIGTGAVVLILFAQIRKNQEIPKAKHVCNKRSDELLVGCTCICTIPPKLGWHI